MIDTKVQIGAYELDLSFPDNTDILKTPSPKYITAPQKAIQKALSNSIGCPRLADIVSRKLFFQTPPMPRQ